LATYYNIMGLRFSVNMAEVNILPQKRLWQLHIPILLLLKCLFNRFKINSFEYLPLNIHHFDDFDVNVREETIAVMLHLRTWRMGFKACNLLSSEEETIYATCTWWQ
ncbi:hypothetical protein ACJX0J_040620, partial [Zea mays]